MPVVFHLVDDEEIVVLDILLRLVCWLLLAPLLPGIINKVKAWVAGRRGPPVLQLYYDLARLWKKSVVMSALASPAFIVLPAVGWVAVVDERFEGLAAV